MLLFLSGIAVVVGVSYFYTKYKAPWINSDIKLIGKLFKFVFRLEKYRKSNVLPIDIFEKTVDRYGEKPMIIFKNDSYSFKEVERRANKVANVALSLGLKQGDTVAILMYNEPDFIWMWLGFQKIGVEVAFLNFNQRKKVLQHSITISGAKALFLNAGPDLYSAVEEIAAELNGIDLYSFRPKVDYSNTFKSLAEVMKSASDVRISSDNYRSQVTNKSTNCLIFTSGTTGLPKPAIVTNAKLHTASYIFNYTGVTADDIIYVPLPFYHSTASLIGFGTVWAEGVTLVLGEKFSASRFFDDCHKHKVTLITYVGEMCRYLVNTPKTKFEKDHSIRAALGNGLRKDIWEEFQSRFEIKQIYEFYGATELPVGFINLDNKAGSVCRITPLTKKILPTAFIRFDKSTGEPIRDKMGFCVRVKTGEPGLLIGLIDKQIPFEGYKNKADDTNKKLMRNVFHRGDTYVNSGDVFYSDENYYYYFYDRLGDTFRWKGENVSTTEVANILSELPFISDACVYGVTIPGCEGRAGMAAMILNDTKNKRPTDEMIVKISEKCVKDLAPYAIPRFLRFQPVLDITSTFKQMKVNLKKEAFNTDIINDPLYYFNLQRHVYCVFDTEVEEKLKKGEIKM